MNIDIIIVSFDNGINGRRLTEQAIQSGRQCGLSHHFIIVETNPQALPYNYPDCTTLYFTEKFNYNACLNMGIQHSTADYVALCNNDLRFYPKCMHELTQQMQICGADSGSPFSQRSTHQHRYKAYTGNYYGWQIGHEFLGWCIVLSRHAVELIKKIDESVEFWYSDNILADQLKAEGVWHILCTTAFVEHLAGGSNTLKYRNGKEIRDLCHNQKSKYDAC